VIRYGEEHPLAVDDRLRIVLVILDGLGDRPLAELDGRTPAEAAATPHLDALVARGASGVHLPFGIGRAPSSELSHWAMFGYAGYPFCGRSVLEGRGHGLAIDPAAVYAYLALRTGESSGDRVWVTGRATDADAADADLLFAALDGMAVDGLTFEIRRLRRGEALLAIRGGASPEVTDTDPFFEHIHPWLRPLPYADAGDTGRAAATAAALESFLRRSRATLLEHAVNRRRVEGGLPSLDVPTTKWMGCPHDVPTFEQRVGLRGGAVTSSSLYRGLAATLGLTAEHLDPDDDPAADLRARLAAAAGLLDRGLGFVHVHTKATDEAGHTKDPFAKLRVLERLDEAIADLASDPFADTVVCVTGDHATPSSGGLLHSGDPTPLVTVGPTVPADGVSGFGEAAARGGRSVCCGRRTSYRCCSPSPTGRPSSERGSPPERRSASPISRCRCRRGRPWIPASSIAPPGERPGPPPAFPAGPAG
jgi:2,3-bisphosphoglycerate-independent phosphoglycerate mutase